MNNQWARQRFELTADTGDSSASATGASPVDSSTGPPFFGEVKQIALRPTDTGAVGDTGGTLRFTLLPDAADTGLGWDVWSLLTGIRNLSIPKMFAPVQNVYKATDGTTDTGWLPIVSAGDSLKVTYTGGRTITDSGHTLTVYVWTGQMPIVSKTLTKLANREDFGPGIN